jgi:hypothetical protein
MAALVVGIVVLSVRPDVDDDLARLKGEMGR